MKPINEMVEMIAAELGLDDAEFAQRKAMLEFTETDIALLRAVHAPLEQIRQSFSDSFYNHLLSFEPLRKLLPDEATINRLKQTQSAYFGELTAGEYGADYIKNRLRVGIVHQRIGLEPKWYVGAYRKYLSDLIPRLWQLCGSDADKFIATYNALLKVVLLDMGLALDTYFQADRQALLQLKLYAEQIVNCMPSGLLVLDPDLTIRSSNRALRRMLDLSENGGEIGQPLEHLFPSPLLRKAALEVIDTSLHQHNLVIELPGESGARWFEFDISGTLLEQEQALLLMVQDITERKQIESQLVYLANHDALTHLPNRNLLHDRIDQAIARAQHAGRTMAALLLDFDRFKNINDSLGHDIGDKVINQVALRLQASVRDGDTVARLGGDEFVIALADLAREEDIVEIAQKILNTVTQPLQVNGHELVLTTSIGISIYPQNGGNAKELLKNADAAMYRAKDAGGNSFRFYAQEMNVRALARLKMETDLRRALEHNEFLLHYQPQVDLASGKVIGMEALLRWQPPGQGLISPAEFISLAEETGLIVPIGEWVLHTACAQNLAWRKAGLAPVTMAVNLSARQFGQQDLVAMVSRTLRETGGSPQWLELEITESMLMENPEEAAATLRELSATGIQLSVDDFGTGYSSLSYLKRFPIHALKIDQSFVRDISTDADDAAITRTVIALAHNLKLKVLAEGVETAAQLEFLRAHGCDQMQGYYFSRPLPAAEIEKLLREGKCLSN